AAPSANKFTKTSPTKLIDVTSVFPDLFVIDGGKCTVGIESTILEILHNQIKIYRPGMISKQEINTLLSQNNIPATISYHESPIAPGSLKHHYMPKTPIITTLGPLHEQDTSSLPKHLLQKTASWKLPINAAIAAREIYGHFRKLDQQETTSMIIEITPKQRIDDHFKGILNRLFKASSYFLPEDLVEES
ncbi:hypothetical protein HOB30_00250, partial [Candidatus Falkowbacteria bacterium]|nr:hypothetical protein [Candidatus Falkowbacteria bacterium]